MKEHTKQTFEKLIELARDHRPHSDAGEFGFETRLRAAMRESEEISVLDVFAAFSFRFSYACIPILVAIGIFLALQTGMDVPAGVGGLLTHWTEFIPTGI